MMPHESVFRLSYRPQWKRNLEEPVEEPSQYGGLLRHEELSAEDMEVSLELGPRGPQSLVRSSGGRL